MRRGSLLQFPDFGPERLQIEIFEGLGFDLVRFTDGDRLVEPVPGFPGIADLAGVAGQVIGDQGFLGELFGGRQQFDPGLGGALHFVESERAVNPADRLVGHDGDDPLGDRVGELPVLGHRVDFPAHQQRQGMKPRLQADLFQLLVRFHVIAQLQPALGGSEIVAVGRFEGDLFLRGAEARAGHNCNSVSSGYRTPYDPMCNEF